MVLSFERSIGNEAGMVIAVAQQPGFADGAIARQRGGEQVGQTPATPKPILIDRFESQRIQRYLIHGIHVVMLMSFPSRHCIRHGAQPGCTWLDETELAVPPTRWPPGLAKSPKPVAGWRGQTKTPTPKAVAT